MKKWCRALAASPHAVQLWPVASAHQWPPVYPRNPHDSLTVVSLVSLWSSPGFSEKLVLRSWRNSLVSPILHFHFYFLLLISLSLRQFDSLSPDCLWILVISLEENLYLGMMSITCWCNKFLTILIVRTCWRCIGFVRLSLLRWVADWVTFKTSLFFIFCFN